MARIWSSGFELNSVGLNVEITNKEDNFSAIESALARSGTYSNEAKSVASVSVGVQYQFASSPTADGYYFRTYMYITTAVSAQGRVVRTIGTGYNVDIRINTDNTLELWNTEDNTQIGSDSSALNTGQWYRIELKVDCTTLSSTSVEARIDGVSFASGTINLADGLSTFIVGKIGSVNGDINFDDIAINDDSGSFQNSYPGAGEIIHLRPNAAGDNTAWNLGTGTSFAEVDEVTPDDITTDIESQTNGEISDFNIDATPAALASDDTINCVQVGMRFSSDSGGGPNFVLRIKASSGGTVEETANIDPNTGTWNTNAVAAPRNYRLTLYDLPGASTTAWTKADLDTAQIGVRITQAGVFSTNVSTLWLLVDHQPAPPSSGKTDWPKFQSRGFWAWDFS